MKIMKYQTLLKKGIIQNTTRITGRIKNISATDRVRILIIKNIDFGILVIIKNTLD